ncbi:MAG: hypothetical protein EYC70_14285 [Planctomycetota bacterium]|nr:MAG: hypothetical protein EYC70_14285 [Planctomycetota bacterium]
MKPIALNFLTLLFCAILAAGGRAQDFNGDGYADLAVGVPNEDGAAPNCGAVHVLYGGPGGLSSTNNQLFDQSTPGLGETAENGDGFGYALAWGDVNGDDIDDLAIGVPFEDIFSGRYPPTNITDTGLVHLLFGSVGSGLSASGSRIYTQASYSGAELEAGDMFGYSIAIGQFYSRYSWREDLAVGAPFETVGSITAAGAVYVFPSPYDTGHVPQRWVQNSPGLTASAPEAYDLFGFSLAHGFLFDSEFLAIGVPFEDWNILTDAGIVHVLYYDNATAALSSSGNQFWYQDSAGVFDVAEAGDRFGQSLATGHFTGDFASYDLAIGVPGESVGAIEQAGAVVILYHDISQRLSATGNQLWTQGSFGIADDCEPFDSFGFALAAGHCDDFYSAGPQDLLIGVPAEDLGSSKVDAGAIHVLFGGPGGLGSSGSQFWTQDSSGILDAAENGDQFGHSVVAGDFDRDYYDEVAACVPWEDIASGSKTNIITDAGAVSVIYSRTGRPGSTGNQFWHQDSLGILGTNETYDAFGFVVYSSE